MTDTTPCDPHREEDEGYLAAEAGRGLSENSYPVGTIRYEQWRRGWRIKNEELRRSVKLGSGDGEEDEGYLAAEAGRSLAENPYPFGTIRHDHWRRGWCIKNQEVQRALRLERAHGLTISHPDPDDPCLAVNLFGINPSGSAIPRRAEIPVPARGRRR